jgi:rhodanese-related sulfurtransferase
VIKGPSENQKNNFLMKRTLHEAAIVLGLAILLAVVATSLRPDVAAFLFQSRPSGASLQPAGGIVEISISDALQQLKQGNVFFLDARSPEDFQAAHISGARNLPESEKDVWLDKFISETDPNTALMVYCSDVHCHLAKDLAETLQFSGFERIYLMKDGLAEWQKQGLPTEKDD